MLMKESCITDTIDLSTDFVRGKLAPRAFSSLPPPKLVRRRQSMSSTDNPIYTSPFKEKLEVAGLPSGPRAQQRGLKWTEPALEILVTQSLYSRTTNESYEPKWVKEMRESGRGRPFRRLALSEVVTLVLPIQEAAGVIFSDKSDKEKTSLVVYHVTRFNGAIRSDPAKFGIDERYLPRSGPRFRIRHAPAQPRPFQAAQGRVQSETPTSPALAFIIKSSSRHNPEIPAGMMGVLRFGPVPSLELGQHQGLAQEQTPRPLIKFGTLSKKGIPILPGIRKDADKVVAYGSRKQPDQDFVIREHGKMSGPISKDLAKEIARWLNGDNDEPESWWTEFDKRSTPHSSTERRSSSPERRSGRLDYLLNPSTCDDGQSGNESHSRTMQALGHAHRRQHEKSRFFPLSVLNEFYMRPFSCREFGLSDHFETHEK
ncbi:hypothetical protein T439DRAFT_369875 [Meredithblackwellia eburnea MCA 4105]